MRTLSKILLAIVLFWLMQLHVHAGVIYYAVYNPYLQRYVLTTNAPGTALPGSAPTFTIESGLPFAFPDAVTNLINTQSVIPALSNDFDTMFPLSLYSIQITNGSAYIFGDYVIYQPPPNFLGIEVFGYTITDSHGNYSSSTISVTTTNITPTNNPVILYPSGLTVVSNLVLSTGKNNYLTNGILTGMISSLGNPLVMVSGPGTNMTVTANGNTKLTLIPDTNFLGTAFGSYAVNDTYTLTNIGQISLVVTNINPIATNDFYTNIVSSTNVYAITLNDFLPPNDPVSVTSISTTNCTGSVTNGTNLFVILPGSVGTATIGYTLSDGVANSRGLATFTITNVVVIPPTANPDSFTTITSSTNAVDPTINDILNNPSGTLQVTAIRPTNCVASLSGNTVTIGTTNPFVSTFGYLVNGFVTNSVFQTNTVGYTLSDGQGGTTTSVISILVTNAFIVPTTMTSPVATVNNLTYFITSSASSSSGAPLVAFTGFTNVMASTSVGSFSGGGTDNAYTNFLSVTNSMTLAPSPITVYGYNFVAEEAGDPVTYWLDSSQDGVSWTTVDTFSINTILAPTGEQNTNRVLNVPAHAPYFRWHLKYISAAGNIGTFYLFYYGTRY